MTQIESQKEVQNAISNKKFKTFALEYMILDGNDDSILQKCHFSGLWSAISNHIEKERYEKAVELYGDNEKFKLHGIIALTEEQTIAVNKQIETSIKPYREALNFLTANKFKLLYRG